MSKILVTAGSTSVPIDRVRVISNVFRGRTGHVIAQAAAAAGHDVTLLTSNASEELTSALTGLCVYRFRMFDELRALMEREIRTGCYDTIIHSAAVSDYRVASVRTDRGPLEGGEAATKIGSSHGSLIIELEPTEKLIDLIRTPWGFKGTLVKFKLQVGVSDAELLQIARRSMETSNADLIVANCLEWARERAYILGAGGTCESVTRDDLPAALLRRF